MARQRVVEEKTRDRPPLWTRLFKRYILPQVWYVHSPVVLLVRASPAAILSRLATASRPSTKRLHHRNLFTQGRRYQVRPVGDGFRLTTTSSVRWRYRKRTTSSAVMNGACSPLGDDFTRLQLHTRINFGYMFDTFLIPVLLAAILWYVPWHRAVIVGALGLVAALSWLGHRYTAALEANEMVWFVQRVLEDAIHTDLPALDSQTDNTLRQDFEDQWRKFYEEKSGKDAAG